MPKSRQSNKKKLSKKSKKYKRIKNNRKSIKQISELDTLLNKKSKPYSLDYILKFFHCKKLFGLFTGIKSKGFDMGRIFFTLIILKFLRIETVNGIYSSEFKEVEAGKDVFYTFKNNKIIPWRKILLESAKIYKNLVSKRNPNPDNDRLQKTIKTLHLDDSDLAKAGKKIEGVGSVWSHVENRMILGYKILVLGFWDGECFIPIDFSLHREKGKSLENALKRLKKNKKEYKEIKIASQKQQKEIAEYQKCKTTAEKNLAAAKQEKSKHQDKEARKQAKEAIKDACQMLKMINRRLKQLGYLVSKLEKELEKKELSLQKAQKHYNKIKKSGMKYGLSKKERAKQFSKKRDRKSYGFKRYAELNSKKNKNAEKMLKRAVCNGFVPDYVLADSWFFSLAILSVVRALSKGSIHYLGMAKIGNILYSIGDKQYKADEILRKYKNQACSCRKIKARYIVVAVKYHSIELNLMLIRLNGTKQWRLLVTTDMKLTFIKAMEIYQIRWSIEVFFKDAKQHLGLGKCQSNDFDAQIADNSIVMIRYIMLSLHKRIHYQQPIGGLFKELSDNLIEANLAQKLWCQFIELQLYIAKKMDYDFEILYKEMLNDEDCNIKLKGVIEIFDCFYKEIRESVDVEEENWGLAA